MATETKTFYLTNFQNGDTMVWNVCSQTGGTGTITLTDDDNTYFSTSKTDATYSYESLDTNSATYSGGKNLRLKVAINDSSTPIKAIINSYNLADESAELVGYGYNIAIEDSLDNDYNDYNDYYISIVALKKAD
ncbi:hypothetical protein [Clostridium felsineum]|uniref:hypothetical protein n=1 Tax=Clostridium felsineum TaxID=36839 RepID=UPI00098C3072|nr:hypothetical protein [Clostridium felsineum]URZ03852.1 hypothetical protein CLAUR_039180 [Clostridium felsineum]